MTAARRGLILVAAAALVAGCSGSSLFERKVDYKSAEKLPPLEVPPDLTRPGRDDRYAVPEINPSGSATYSEYSAERQGARGAVREVLPVPENVRLVRDGDTRYLVVREPPEKVWPRVRDFWQENGFLLKLEMPEAGVMETDWAENRAKIPQDPLRNVLGKFLDQVYSTGERDKFRTRLERAPDGGSTEIYVSHRGMVEQLTTGKAGTGEYDSSVWQPRPPDPELEAEFLRRLMVKLGLDEERAKAQLTERRPREERAKLLSAGDGAPMLSVTEPFDRAWRRVGLALDRVGFTVEDRDRSKGIYFVRYADPNADAKKDEGLLGKLAFWRASEPPKAAQYQVVVQARADTSEVSVYDKEGRPDTSGTSKKILSLLYDQLK